MKAVLDHVGIAVKNLPAALAFYRDALGLEVEAPEEVTSQRVRAHFIPVGASNLELLEATAPDSPIAKYLEKRGPGLHHITLRVEDVFAAVAQLKARGVRMIDETPRPGAEGSTIAFVHPSATHGVLVELKQAAPATSHPPPATSPDSQVKRFSLGELDLISVCDGFIRFDGGAMFGTVPKVMWSKQQPPDEGNRVLLAMRALVVRGARTMIIDAGLGDKEDAKFHEIYGVDRSRNLDHTLAEAGVGVDDIDIVLATHLHFDHAGGFTIRDASGRVRPRFPRAQYIIRRGEWEDATHPHARNRASYLRGNYMPLADAGVLQLVDEDQMIMPGVRVRRTGGHTMHHQMVTIESGGTTAAFVADLMPFTSHVSDAWIMGYDLYPMDTLAAKQRFVKDAIAKETLVFFEHDPVVAAGYIREENGKRIVVAGG
ncbi:MAG: methylmalonyl-CoA epimerase [Acidobacteria bacterium]|nr:methylmalonyl-CoA epimerase [Acidobacteriota bacterium]